MERREDDQEGCQQGPPGQAESHVSVDGDVPLGPTTAAYRPPGVGSALQRAGGTGGGGGAVQYSVTASGHIPDNIVKRVSDAHATAIRHCKAKSEAPADSQ